jgi:hypothetical protein
MQDEAVLYTPLDGEAEIQRMTPVLNHTRAWLEAAPSAVRASSESESP